MSLTFFAFSPFPLSPDTAGEERRGVGRLLLPNNPYLLLDPDSFTRKKEKKKKGVSNNQPPPPHMENEEKLLLLIPCPEFRIQRPNIYSKRERVSSRLLTFPFCVPQIFLFRHLRFFFLNNNNKTGT